MSSAASERVDACPFIIARDGSLARSACAEIVQRTQNVPATGVAARSTELGVSVDIGVRLHDLAEQRRGNPETLALRPDEPFGEPVEHGDEFKQ